MRQKRHSKQFNLVFMIKQMERDGAGWKIKYTAKAVMVILSNLILSNFAINSFFSIFT